MTDTETPDKILDAVHTMIVEHGVHGTSLRLVADEAEVSLGLLSYHFVNKESLILAAFIRAVQVVRAPMELALAQSQDPSERVRLFLRGLFAPELLAGAFPALAVACWSMALSDDAVGTMIGDYRDAGVNLASMLVGAARADLTADEAHLRGLDVIASIDSLTLHWARFGDEAALERGLRRCEALALDER